MDPRSLPRPSTRRLSCAVVVGAALLTVSLTGDAPVLAEPPAPPVPTAPQEGGEPRPVPAPPQEREDGEPVGKPAAEPPNPSDADEPTDPAPSPKPESDPAALALLAKAAEQQGGAELAAKDALKSFRVQFHRARFSIERSQEDGSSKTITIETDSKGLSIAWMAPDYLRTDWTQDGETTTRAYHKRRNVNWMRDPDDPGRTLILNDEKYRTDREQIARDRRMIRTLLDVVFLERLRRDGSVWSTSDAGYPLPVAKDSRAANHVAEPEKLQAILRHPPGGRAEDASALGMALWIDPATGQVRAAYIPERATGDQPLYFALSYHEAFPTRHGTDAKFPFGVAVFDDPRAKPIMNLTVGEIHVNDPGKVNEKTFSPSGR